jgi:hypothetical protein
MIGAFRRKTACFLGLFIVSGAVFAQETARWLDSAPEAKPYAAIVPRLVSGAEAVVSAGVGERLYLERLKEGVRKRASAERLGKAMEEESARLVFMAGELEAAGFRMASEARDRVLSDGALSLRSSVSREEFSAVVRTVAARGGPADRIAAAVSAIAAADPARGVAAALRLELAAALAASAVKTDRLDSVASVFARGRSFGLSPDRIARIVAAELASGGSLAAVDAAMNKERRQR